MDLTERNCIPCEGGTSSLSNSSEDSFLQELYSWEIDRTTVHKITRLFTFKNFLKAIEFVNSVAKIAEQEGHHPDIKISYRKVTIELYTHAIQGLSENDFIMAAKIDTLVE